jgi:hypothetical protein
LTNLEKNIDKSSEFAINRAREADIATKKKKIENLKHLLAANRSVFTDSQIENMRTSLRILETEVARSIT